MRRIISVSMLAAVCSLPTASAKDVFTCEKIKEKSVRASCIESRDSKQDGAAKLEEIEVKKKEEVAALDKSKEMEAFVATSKDVLTKNYKDPSSVQFTNLVVSDRSKINPGWIALCGSVNGKNSYGGYVGVKMFYVHWKGSKNPDIWIHGERGVISYDPYETHPKGWNRDESELDIAKSVCGNMGENILTPVR
jgi:hypothetical protein